MSNNNYGDSYDDYDEIRMQQQQYRQESRSHHDDDSDDNNNNHSDYNDGGDNLVVVANENDRIDTDLLIEKLKKCQLEERIELESRLEEELETIQRESSSLNQLLQSIEMESNKFLHHREDDSVEEAKLSPSEQQQQNDDTRKNDQFQLVENLKSIHLLQSRTMKIQSQLESIVSECDDFMNMNRQQQQQLDNSTSAHEKEQKERLAKEEKEEIISCVTHEDGANENERIPQKERNDEQDNDDANNGSNGLLQRLQNFQLKENRDIKNVLESIKVQSNKFKKAASRNFNVHRRLRTLQHQLLQEEHSCVLYLSANKQEQQQQRQQYHNNRGSGDGRTTSGQSVASISCATTVSNTTLSTNATFNTLPTITKSSASPTATTSAARKLSATNSALTSSLPESQPLSPISTGTRTRVRAAAGATTTSTSLPHHDDNTNNSSNENDDDSRRNKTHFYNKILHAMVKRRNQQYQLHLLQQELFNEKREWSWQLLDAKRKTESYCNDFKKQVLRREGKNEKGTDQQEDRAEATNNKNENWDDIQFMKLEHDLMNERNEVIKLVALCNDLNEQLRSKGNFVQSQMQHLHEQYISEQQEQNVMDENDDDNNKNKNKKATDIMNNIDIINNKQQQQLQSFRVESLRIRYQWMKDDIDYEKYRFKGSLDKLSKTQKHLTTCINPKSKTVERGGDENDTMEHEEKQQQERINDNISKIEELQRRKQIRQERKKRVYNDYAYDQLHQGNTKDNNRIDIINKGYTFGTSSTNNSTSTNNKTSTTTFLEELKSRHSQELQDLRILFELDRKEIDPSLALVLNQMCDLFQQSQLLIQEVNQIMEQWEMSFHKYSNDDVDTLVAFDETNKNTNDKNTEFASFLLSKDDGKHNQDHNDENDELIGHDDDNDNSSSRLFTIIKQIEDQHEIEKKDLQSILSLIRREQQLKTTPGEQQKQQLGSVDGSSNMDALLETMQIESRRVQDAVDQTEDLQSKVLQLHDYYNLQKLQEQKGGNGFVATGTGTGTDTDGGGGRSSGAIEDKTTTLCTSAGGNKQLKILKYLHDKEKKEFETQLQTVQNENEKLREELRKVKNENEEFKKTAEKANNQVQQLQEHMRATITGGDSATSSTRRIVQQLQTLHSIEQSKWEQQKLDITRICSGLMIVVTFTVCRLQQVSDQYEEEKQNWESELDIAKNMTEKYKLAADEASKKLQQIKVQYKYRVAQQPQQQTQAFISSSSASSFGSKSKTRGRSRSNTSQQLQCQQKQNNNNDDNGERITTTKYRGRSLDSSLREERQRDQEQQVDCDNLQTLFEKLQNQLRRQKEVELFGGTSSTYDDGGSNDKLQSSLRDTRVECEKYRSEASKAKYNLDMMKDQYEKHKNELQMELEFRKTENEELGRKLQETKDTYKEKQQDLESLLDMAMSQRDSTLEEAEEGSDLLTQVHFLQIQIDEERNDLIYYLNAAYDESDKLRHIATYTAKQLEKRRQCKKCQRCEYCREEDQQEPTKDKGLSFGGDNVEEQTKGLLAQSNGCANCVELQNHLNRVRHENEKERADFMASIDQEKLHLIDQVETLDKEKDQLMDRLLKVLEKFETEKKEYMSSSEKEKKVLEDFLNKVQEEHDQDRKKLMSAWDEKKQLVAKLKQIQDRQEQQTRKFGTSVENDLFNQLKEAQEEHKQEKRALVSALDEEKKQLEDEIEKMQHRHEQDRGELLSLLDKEKKHLQDELKKVQAKNEHEMQRLQAEFEELKRLKNHRQNIKGKPPLQEQERGIIWSEKLEGTQTEKLSSSASDGLEVTYEEHIEKVQDKGKGLTSPFVDDGNRVNNDIDTFGHGNPFQTASRGHNAEVDANPAGTWLSSMFGSKDSDKNQEEYNELLKKAERCVALEKQLKLCQDECNLVSEEVEMLRKKEEKRSYLQTQLDNRTEEINGLREKAETCRYLQNQLDMKIDKCDDLEEELKSCKKLLQEKVDLCERLHNEMGSDTNERGERNEFKALREKVDLLQNEADRCDVLQRELEASKNECSQMQEKVEKYSALQEQLDVSEEECSELRAKLIEAESLLKEFNSRLRESQSQLQSSTESQLQDSQLNESGDFIAQQEQSANPFELQNDPFEVRDETLEELEERLHILSSGLAVYKKKEMAMVDVEGEGEASQVQTKSGVCKRCFELQKIHAEEKRELKSKHDEEKRELKLKIESLGGNSEQIKKSSKKKLHVSALTKRDKTIFEDKDIQDDNSKKCVGCTELQNQLLVFQGKQEEEEKKWRATLSNEKSRLKGELDEVSEERRELQLELASCREEISILSEKVLNYDENERRLKQLQDKMDAESDADQQLELELAEKDKRVAAAEQRTADVEEQLQRVKDQHAHEKEEMEQLLASARQESVYFLEIEKEFTDLKNQLLLFQRRLEKEKKELESELENTKSERDNFRLAAEEASSLLRQLKDADMRKRNVAEEEPNCDSSQGSDDFQDAEQQIKELEDQLLEQKNARKSLEEKLEQLKNEYQTSDKCDLEAQLRMAEEECAQLREKAGRCDEAEEKLKELQNQFNFEKEKWESKSKLDGGTLNPDAKDKQGLRSLNENRGIDANASADLPEKEADDVDEIDDPVELKRRLKEVRQASTAEIQNAKADIDYYRNAADEAYGNLDEQLAQLKEQYTKEQKELESQLTRAQQECIKLQYQLEKNPQLQQLQNQYYTEKRTWESRLKSAQAEIEALHQRKEGEKDIAESENGASAQSQREGSQGMGGEDSQEESRLETQARGLRVPETNMSPAEAQREEDPNPNGCDNDVEKELERLKGELETALGDVDYYRKAAEEAYSSIDGQLEVLKKQYTKDKNELETQLANVRLECSKKTKTCEDLQEQLNQIGNKVDKSDLQAEDSSGDRMQSAKGGDDVIGGDYGDEEPSSETGGEDLSPEEKCIKLEEKLKTVRRDSALKLEQAKSDVDYYSHVAEEAYSNMDDQLEELKKQYAKDKMDLQAELALAQHECNELREKAEMCTKLQLQMQELQNQFYSEKRKWKSEQEGSQSDDMKSAESRDTEFGEQEENETVAQGDSESRGREVISSELEQESAKEQIKNDEADVDYYRQAADDAYITMEEQLEELKSQHSKEKQELEAQLELSQQECSELRSRLEEGYGTQLQQLQNQLFAEKRKWQSQLDSAQTEIEKLRVAGPQNNNPIKSYSAESSLGGITEQERVEWETKFEQLKSESDRFRQEAASTCTDMSEQLEHLKDQYVKEKKGYETELARAQEELKDVTGALDLAKSEVDKYKSATEKAERQFEQLKSQHHQNKKGLDELVDVLNKLQELQDQQEKEKQEWKAELEHARGEHDKEKNHWEDQFQALNSRLEQEKSKWERQLEWTKSEFESAKGECDKLREDYAKLVEETERAKNLDDDSSFSPSQVLMLQKEIWHLKDAHELERKEWNEKLELARVGGQQHRNDETLGKIQQLRQQQDQKKKAVEQRLSGLLAESHSFSETMGITNLDENKSVGSSEEFDLK